jgi:pimeloyl-ACP methyl ester carboxylesterase
LEEQVVDVRHRQVATNGISMHVAEAGPDDGPVVLLCHGFPESWWSWRHQLGPLAAAGWHVVAPDMRGFGGTTAPADPRAYTTLHHVGDLVGLLDELGTPAAVVVGHDWGAPVAWQAALVRPDRFRAVAGLSVAWSPRGEVAPVAGMQAALGGAWFYFTWFQEPGVAEAELDANVRAFLRGFLFTLSADAPGDALTSMLGGDASGILERLAQPEVLPAWLAEDDLDHYAGEFERTGFRGGLSWYRCADLSWELTRAWADARITQPALFVAGERDPVLAMNRGAEGALAANVPGLTRTVLLPGCGHWTQQEQPQAVNDALLEFLADLPGR